MTIVVAVSNILLVKCSFAGFQIPTRSGIEVSKDKNLVVGWEVLQEFAQIGLEFALFCRICLKSWGIDTEQSGMMLIAK